MIEKGKTLGAAAAVAGMSERTARRWKNGVVHHRDDELEGQREHIRRM
jgi:hypothetical protein